MSAPPVPACGVDHSHNSSAITTSGGDVTRTRSGTYNFVDMSSQRGTGEVFESAPRGTAVESERYGNLTNSRRRQQPQPPGQVPVSQSEMVLGHDYIHDCRDEQGLTQRHVAQASNGLNDCAAWSPGQQQDCQSQLVHNQWGGNFWNSSARTYKSSPDNGAMFPGQQQHHEPPFSVPPRRRQNDAYHEGSCDGWPQSNYYAHDLSPNGGQHEQHLSVSQDRMQHYPPERVQQQQRLPHQQGDIYWEKPASYSSQQLSHAPGETDQSQQSNHYQQMGTAGQVEGPQRQGHGHQGCYSGRAEHFEMQRQQQLNYFSRTSGGKQQHARQDVSGDTIRMEHTHRQPQEKTPSQQQQFSDSDNAAPSSSSVVFPQQQHREDKRKSAQPREDSFAPSRAAPFDLNTEIKKLPPDLQQQVEELHERLQKERNVLEEHERRQGLHAGRLRHCLDELIKKHERYTIALSTLKLHEQTEERRRSKVDEERKRAEGEERQRRKKELESYGLELSKKIDGTAVLCEPLRILMKQRCNRDPPSSKIEDGKEGLEQTKKWLLSRSPREQNEILRQSVTKLSVFLEERRDRVKKEQSKDMLARIDRSREILSKLRNGQQCKRRKRKAFFDARLKAASSSARAMVQRSDRAVADRLLAINRKRRVTERLWDLAAMSLETRDKLCRIEVAAVEERCARQRLDEKAYFGTFLHSLRRRLDCIAALEQKNREQLASSEERKGLERNCGRPKKEDGWGGKVNSVMDMVSAEIVSSLKLDIERLRHSAVEVVRKRRLANGHPDLILSDGKSRSGAQRKRHVPTLEPGRRNANNEVTAIGRTPEDEDDEFGITLSDVEEVEKRFHRGSRSTRNATRLLDYDSDTEFNGYLSDFSFLH